MNLGYKDVPVESLETDVLEVKDYVLSLAAFIRQCETPMTVAIQGDWGSGKTSMMNMIRSEVSSDLHCVWFNTWQYSQFNMGGMLAVSLLNSVIRSVEGDPNLVASVFGAIKNGVGFVAKSGVNFAVETLAGETNAGLVAEAMGGTPNLENASQMVVELKVKLAEALEKKLKKDKKQRAAIFVDDLDRLPPEKAVELLEVMKLFMDIDRAVFVLAIDYQVVVQGLEKKFGTGIGTEKGRSFFDKIIQLPFSVPMAHYKVDRYISDLLKRMGVAQGSGSELYVGLINTSIGFNPRSVKRLFNSFLLLNDVSERRRLMVAGDPLRPSKQRLLFATLCLQMSFPELYSSLLRMRDDLNTELLTSLTFEGNYGDELLNGVPVSPGYGKRASQFMEQFRLACDLDANDDLSVSEIESLKQILSSSTLTSSRSSDTEVDEERGGRVRLASLPEFLDNLRTNKKLPEPVLGLAEKIHEATLAAAHSEGRMARVNFTGEGSMTFNIPESKKQRVFLYLRVQKKAVVVWFPGEDGLRITTLEQVDTAFIQKAMAMYDQLSRR